MSSLLRILDPSISNIEGRQILQRSQEIGDEFSSEMQQRDPVSTIVEGIIDEKVEFENGASQLHAAEEL